MLQYFNEVPVGPSPSQNGLVCVMGTHLCVKEIRPPPRVATLRNQRLPQLLRGGTAAADLSHISHPRSPEIK